MEIVITTDTIIKAASLITALGVIGGAVAWCIKFLGRQKQQDKELKAIRTKTGETGGLNVADMPAKIRSIGN